MKSIEKITKGFGCIFVLLLFLIPYFIGSRSENVWVGILVFTGILLAWLGTILYSAQETLKSHLIPGLLSLLLLAAAIWFSRLAGRWWWAGVWLMVALAHYATAIDAWQEEDSHMRVALTLGIISTAAAFLTPTWLWSILQGHGTVDLSSAFGTGLLVVLAFIALGIAWYQGYRKSEEKQFIGWSLTGIGLLVGATWLSRLAGGWWWSLPWALAALLIGHAAYDLRQYSFGRSAGSLGLIIALVCVLFAIGGPAFLPAYLESRSLGRAPMEVPTPSVPPSVTISPTLPTPTTAPEPTATPAPSRERIQVYTADGWRALGDFIRSAIRSVWGIFHLFTLFALGYLWLRRGWGSLFLILLLLFAVWLAGGVVSPVDETLTWAFSSGPAAWMKEMLLFSAERWGSMAWGILLTAFLTSVAIVPLIRFSSKINRIWGLQADLERGVSTIQQRIASAIATMGIRPLDTILVTYVLFAIPVGSWIALWVALRQAAAAGGLPLGFAHIPDLTVPHWKPIWDLRYYSLALALWLTGLLLRRLQQKYDPPAPLYQGCTIGWVLFLSAFLSASLVPAGVMLFSIGMVASQILLFPARVIGIAEIPPIRPSIVPSSPPMPVSKPGPPVPEVPAVPVERRLESFLVWQSDAPLVAMIEWQGMLWLLREDGDLVRYTGTIQKWTLPVSRGQAVYALKESDNQILVTGNGKRVLWLNAQSLEAVREATLSQPADAATLNPYKTMLAWVNVSNATAAMLVLASGKEISLISGLNLAPALAFSSDGRYLAVGGSGSAIYLLDVATRQVSETLDLPETSPSAGQAIRALFGRKGGGWLSVYADRRIVLWNIERTVEKQTRLQRRIMALDFHMETGRLALGLSDGILQVFDADLNKIFDETVQEKDITCVCFSQDGRSVFTIGNKTEVRRVDL